MKRLKTKKITTTVQVLTHIKEKLQFEQAQKVQLATLRHINLKNAEMQLRKNKVL